jgi:hypothetical protein
VTALYSSIFAGAAVADAKVKEKRRLEWEEKILAVKEEVKDLVDEEVRLLEALTSRQPKLNKFMQRRDYTTDTRSSWAAEAAKHEELDTSRFGLIHRRYQESLEPEIRENDRCEAVEAEAEDFDDMEDLLFEYARHGDSENVDGRAPRPEPDFIWENGDIIRIKAVQKLALRQLALRFMLRPSVAHDYAGLPLDYPANPSVRQFQPEDLLRELQSARRRLYTLKYVKDTPYEDLMRDMNIREYDESRRIRHTRDGDVKTDISAYLHHHIPLQELLMRLANNLMSCDEPDRPRALQLMIVAFTRTKQNDLVDLVLKALIPNLFELTTPLIISILTYFRKSKNLKAFDQFLQMLRGEGGYYVNLKATWEQKVVNGIEITIPPLASSNPVLFNTLIAATLRFGQADRAQAFLQVYRAHGFADDFGTLCAFFRFYTIRKNWESGISTILRALSFMASSTSHPEKRIGRLIVHMVHFCDSCQQGDIAASLVGAAVQSGFDWQIALDNRDLASDFDPVFQRWRDAAKEADMPVRPNKTISAKCHDFVSLVHETITNATTTITEGITRPREQLQQDYIVSLSSVTRLELQRGREARKSHPATPDVEDAPSNPTLSQDQGHPTPATTTSNQEILSLRAQMSRLQKMVDLLAADNPIANKPEWEGNVVVPSIDSPKWTRRIVASRTESL